MEIREILNLLEGLEEGRRLYRQEGSLEKWTKDAESAGHRVVHHDGRKDPNSTHHAINRDGKVVGKFFNATYTNNKRGFLHTENVAEGEKKPHPKTWHDVDKKLGKAVDKMSQAEKVKKGFAHPDTLKKKGVAEGSESGVRVVDQDYDLDQVILTLDIEGKRASFTYTDYDEDFENAERRDVFDQLQNNSWYKGLDHPTKMEILDAAYRAIRGLEPQPYQPSVGLEPMDVGDKLDEQQVDEADPVARITRLHQELSRR